MAKGIVSKWRKQHLKGGKKKYRIGDRHPPVNSHVHRKPQKYYAPIRPANNNSSNSGKQIK